MEDSKKLRVLVTGATGFVGSQMAKLLLENKYLVRGTVRSKLNEKKLAPLKSLPNQSSLEIVEADLLKPDTWDSAVSGCAYVMHIASPFMIKTPSDENELIRPAVEGTMAVLKACAKNNVKHVVITSSIVAIMSGYNSAKKDYTEADWADIDTVPAYNKSKTIAEREAWKYYNSLPKETRFKMTTINPGYIVGPSLVDTDFASGDLIRQILTGSLIAIPNIYSAIVDVRDVAKAHLKAIESKNTDGQRYICCAKKHLWFEDIAKILDKEFSKYGYKVASRKFWYIVVKLASFWNYQASGLLPFWDKDGILHNEKIVKELGMEFIGVEEGILSLAYSLIKNGIIPDLIHAKSK